MQGLIQAINDIGFPIMVSLYLLLKIEKQLEVLTESIIKLNEEMNNIKYENEKNLKYSIEQK